MSDVLSQLPSKPEDRYRLRWFEVDEDGIHERAAVYYVNSTYNEVCPDSDRDGAAFINQWQLFNNGRFTARTNRGWVEALTEEVPLCAVATRDQAEQIYLPLLTSSIDKARREVAECEEKLRKLRRRIDEYRGG